MESFKSRQRNTVKLMIRKAKPWIIACGTFSWRVDDPGDVVLSIDAIVAESFADACRERAQRLVLLTEHVTCVRTI